MKQLNHPNIVHMAGMADFFLGEGYSYLAIPPLGIVKKPIALVTEFLPYGSLYEFLQRKDAPKTLHWAMRMRIILDVAQGVAFMHSLRPQIMHRDLKTLNVLVLLVKARLLLQYSLC